MSERFGLITRIKRGSEKSAFEVSIWQLTESRVHVRYVDDVSEYKVGYWLRYSSDGEINLGIYKMLKNAKVAVSTREGTIRVTTEVTFPPNGTGPFSELLGRVSVTKGTKPKPGTYLCHLYFLREEEMRLHHEAAWLFVGIVASEESTSSFTNVDSLERPLSPLAPVEPETHTQSSTLSVHVPNRLEECQSFEDLENFVAAFRSHFERITVDFENLGNRVQNVKIVTFFTTVDGLAVCFSPSYGWCVAKQGLTGFSLSTFTETFQRGTWLSVNIFPSVTEDGYHSVVNWIICPKYNVSAAPFKLFCANREAELLIVEALAFNHVKQRIANAQKRFVLLDTPMGEVWLPGAVECSADLQTDPLVFVSRVVSMWKTSYGQYEHSFKSVDVNLNQSGSAVKSTEHWEKDSFWSKRTLDPVFQPRIAPPLFRFLQHNQRSASYRQFLPRELNRVDRIILG